MIWQPRFDFTTKLLYGSAFRAPSFGELYVTNNPVALGNPNLEPEIVKTWELAFDYRATDNLHLAMNLVNYQVSDKIIPISDPSVTTAGAIVKNAGSREAQGLELEARWKITTQFSLLANYAFVEAIDENNDHDVGNYPRHSAYFRTDWLLYSNWYLDTQINWIGELRRVYGDPRTPINDYTTVDLTLRRKEIKKGHWNLATSVRNLLDADVRDPSLGPDSSGVINIPNDLPQAGRNYWLELRYRF